MFYLSTFGIPPLDKLRSILRCFYEQNRSFDSWQGQGIANKGDISCLPLIPKIEIANLPIFLLKTFQVISLIKVDPSALSAFHIIKFINFLVSQIIQIT